MNHETIEKVKTLAEAKALCKDYDRVVRRFLHEIATGKLTVRRNSFINPVSGVADLARPDRDLGMFIAMNHTQTRTVTEDELLSELARGGEAKPKKPLPKLAKKKRPAPRKHVSRPKKPTAPPPPPPTPPDEGEGDGEGEGDE